MSQRTAPLHDRLRAIDAGLAERQTGLIAALNARSIEGATLTARVAFERDRRAVAAWIRFRSGDRAVYLAPLLVDGGLARLARGPDGPDPAVAAALLAPLEPVVAAIETALGTELYPDGLDTADPSDTVLLRIDAIQPGGAIRHRVLAALPLDGDMAMLTLPPEIPSALGALRWRWTARFEGPSLRTARIATIGQGDMMLLGLRPLRTIVQLPGRSRRIGGQIDLIRGIMALHNEIEASADRDHAAASAPIDWDELRVPTVIEIDGALISGSEVAALGGGSVLPLPSSGGTLPVRVVAGGTVIGTGELVAVGEGFGILFTSVTASGDAAADA